MLASESASLLTLLEGQEPVALDVLLKHLESAETAFDEDAKLDSGESQRLASVLCSRLRDHEDFRDSRCICGMLRVISRLLAQDPANENIAVQRGLLSTTTNLISSMSGDPNIVRCCLEAIALLNVAESSDSILSRLGAVQLIMDLVTKHQANAAVIEDVVTTLALLAKRTRHRRTMSQVGIGSLLDVLKSPGLIPSLVVAVCRFLSNFAVKEECCISVLQNGGIDALTSAFRQSLSLRFDGPCSPVDVQAAVAGALCTCTTDCADVQRAVLQSGWLPSLAEVLRANTDHAGVHEAGMGIVRALCRNASDRKEIVSLGFVPLVIASMRAFPDNTTVLKEACGAAGNLSGDPEIRVLLGESGVVDEVFRALQGCRTNEDRKVAKLALGALSNLANAEANRDILARIGAVSVLLEAARLFMGNENILEYAIGAISHLSTHDLCNQQLVRAGAVEALLLFMGDHQEDLQVVSRSLVALRRLVKHSQSADTGQRPDPAVLSLVTRAGCRDGAHGVQLLVDAMSAHVYDDVVVKEAALILASLVGNPAVVPAVVATAVPSCMKALEVHGNDAPVADALAGLMAQLPLEELPAFTQEFGVAAGADG